MTKYKLKEIWDISEKERDEIYRYALERSYEICGSPELDEETMERIERAVRMRGKKTN